MTDALAAPGNALLVSAASVWEIVIKAALGRLCFPLDRIDAILERAGMMQHTRHRDLKTMRGYVRRARLVQDSPIALLDL